MQSEKIFELGYHLKHLDLNSEPIVECATTAKRNVIARCALTLIQPGHASTVMSMSKRAHTIADLYERHAVTWATDRNRAPWLEKAWHQKFVERLPQGAAVLDIGCGSGVPVAQYLSSKGCRITGVDTSPTLISICKTKLPDHEWHVADMRHLCLGRRFDGLLAWDSFFHLSPDDQRRMFPIFDKHAGASGLLMFNTGPECGEAIGTYQNEPLYHASLNGQEYRSLLDRAGFDVVTHVVQNVRADGRTIWLAQSRRKS